MQRKNYFFVDLPAVRNGEVFEDCNLARAVPSRIFDGKTGLRFVRCNMTNCVPPKDSLLESCNCAQIEFSRSKMLLDNGPTIIASQAMGMGDEHIVTMRGSRARKAIAADLGVER